MAKDSWTPPQSPDYGNSSAGNPAAATARRVNEEADAFAADAAATSDARGYDRLAAAEQDHDVIVSLLTDMRQELEQAIGGMAAAERAHAAMAMTLNGRLEAIVGALMRQGVDQDPGTGAAAMQTTEMLTDEIQAAEQVNPRSLWNRMLDTIKSLSKHLWSMISHLLKVKEWTLSGEAGVSLLGLAKVGITVTFG
jgi:hypothetical protein